MGDRVYAHFDIDGLTEAQANNLCEMMDVPDTKASDDLVMALYEAIRENYIDEVEPDNIDGKHSFRLVKYEANYGDNAFDDFKALCTAHRLPYSCYWMQGGDYGAGFVWWHPAFEGHGEIERSTDGEQVVISQAMMIRFLHWFNSGGGAKYGLTLEQAIAVLYEEPGACPSVILSGVTALLEVDDALNRTISTT